MAIVDSVIVETIEFTPPVMEPSPSKLASDVARESSYSSDSSFTTDTPDRSNDQFKSNGSPSRDLEPSPALLRSEEYRQLFRLPPEEVLVQDFNCACQENILLQGHMYLFVHCICFYSNIFGFETKKIIPFHEITSVKRAKTAGIFPNAIEIIAGGRKHFFASFLSRDEAFKLINDGWLQHSNGATTLAEQQIMLQESLSESSSHENGLVVIESVNSSKNLVDELKSIDRDGDASVADDSVPPPNIENDLSTTSAELQDIVEQVTEPAVNSVSSSSATAWSWKVENDDAPKITEDYTKVAESKFPIKVEEFFSMFFSDDALGFKESFHRQSGDKELRCSSWRPHDEFGNFRHVSFQHPLKILFGPKFGSCKEVQKFRVYRNSHLVIETSQQINDVPFGDCFRVEGIWDVVGENDGSKECCVLRVYVNVAFTKRTVWKGKIVQSTLEECREAYAIWINLAHELLKLKNLEKQEAASSAGMMNGEGHSKREAKSGEPSQRLHDAGDSIGAQKTSDSMDGDQRVGNFLEGNLINTTSIAPPLLEETMKKFGLFLKSQSLGSIIMALAFTVIILMQVSILVLLDRPQFVNMAPPMDYMSGGIGERSAELAWLERRMHHLKDEMLMVEARLERMRHEHAFLKTQLKDLEHLPKQR
ncbi:GRAM domain-containing protein [Cephalotus follicularis]|uniref:GRAM domain-containing protein n=1 Tax=Cephalotus follicularis TaxID=3775 RepID=A0A1Q3CQD3_CEPFO|nr:GRAM domain-containing protein [Cephalotus follicularis]